MNKDGVLGLLTGVGTAKAAASVMALGLDPRFDLSHAYWLVAGIGGGDPADVSLGSAVWAEHVIDGDLAYEIDARDIPEDWPTGYVPLRKNLPYEQPLKPELEGELYTLNPQLVDWAYRPDTRRRSPIPTRSAPPEPVSRVSPTPSGRPSWPKATPFPEAPSGTAHTWTNGPTPGPAITRRAGQLHDFRHGRHRHHAGLTFLTKPVEADLNRVLVLRTVSNTTAKRPARRLRKASKASFSEPTPPICPPSKPLRSWAIRWFATSDHWQEAANTIPK